METRMSVNGVRRSVPSNHAAAYKYRCRECNGRGYVDVGRVRVNHRHDCSIWLRLVLTYPRFSRMLELYRTPQHER